MFLAEFLLNVEPSLKEIMNRIQTNLEPNVKGNFYQFLKKIFTNLKKISTTFLTIFLMEFLYQIFNIFSLPNLKKIHQNFSTKFLTKFIYQTFNKISILNF